MIDLKPSGLKIEDTFDLVGLIVMSDAGNQFTSYSKPIRVTEVGPKSVSGYPLKRKLSESGKFFVYLDESTQDDGQYSVPLKSVKLICDNAEEVNAVRAMNEEIEQQFHAFLKGSFDKFLELSLEMAVKQKSGLAL